MNIFKRLFGKKNDSFLKQEEKNQHFSHNREGKTLLVITVGDETTFSIDCINYYFNERKFTNVDLLFVSTPSMQKKNKIKSMEKGNPIDFPSQNWGAYTVVIDEYNDPKKDIYEKLNSFLDGKIYSNVYVNVSNGTRFTGFIVSEYFKEKYKNNAFLNVICFYRREKDQKTKVQIVFSNDNAIEDAKAKFTEGRSINNYFEQFGCSIINQGRCIKTEEELIKLLPILSGVKEYKRTVENVRTIVGMMNSLKQQKKDNNDIQMTYSLDNDVIYFEDPIVHKIAKYNSGLSQTDYKSIYDYLTLLGFNGTLSLDELFFACDGWFEELAYYLFKRKYKLNDNQIAINISIKSQKEIMNEFDVSYINPECELSIVECKNSTSEDVYNNAFYKLDSISKKLSKSVQRIIFCRLGSNFSPKRANESNVKVVNENDINEMLNEFYGEGIRINKSSKKSKYNRKR